MKQSQHEDPQTPTDLVKQMPKDKHLLYAYEIL